PPPRPRSPPPPARPRRPAPPPVAQAPPPLDEAHLGAPLRGDPPPELGADLVLVDRCLRGHRPSKRGGLRSAAARTPSDQSPVRRRRSCSSASRVIAVRARSARSPRMVERMERTASGADAGISAAKACAT